MSGIISQTHAHGLRRTNLRQLREEIDAVLTSSGQAYKPGKRSQSSIYRALKARVNESRRGVGFTFERGQKKNRIYSAVYFLPEADSFLQSVIFHVPFRYRDDFTMDDGPLLITGHALARLHERSGRKDGFELWAREFNTTLKLAYIVAKRPELRTGDQDRQMLPTKNGVLLGRFEEDRFIGLTWLHLVDLNDSQRDALEQVAFSLRGFDISSTGEVVQNASYD